ncbi:hypothetical protein [Skermania piniformis]|uniref:Class I SAM-dependent methyltransferase n=1 Tax=Skermania pinensis TaxID=39122 RepID=A0ABX8SAJ2_9ACTN|nr:hypothetical protein [Skermania piniformis]QXQ14883.1 hypothetical protein KV203_05740 [Skermania piniformis]
MPSLTFLTSYARGYSSYYVNRRVRSAWGGPFNGQEGRRAIFATLLDVVKPDLLVETGTFLATTTRFLARSGVDVVTVEGSAEYFGFAQASLLRCRNVESRFGDSRSVLRALFDSPKYQQRRVLAYLDAHWASDLPLAEEIEIIFGRHPDAVVLVDDFQVPGDAGYGYDDYGPGKALIPEYIAPALAAFDLVALYPTLPADDETGARRGCVVVAPRNRSAELCATQLLQSADDGGAEQPTATGIDIAQSGAHPSGQA